jgi:ACT domain-containing protein
MMGGIGKRSLPMARRMCINHRQAPRTPLAAATLVSHLGNRSRCAVHTLQGKRIPMAQTQASQICIVTVAGVDKVGIIARLSTAMAKANINIVDVNQKIMEEYFVMTMAIDIGKAAIDMGQIKKRLDAIGRQMGLKITVQDESIFKAMHRV